RALIDFQLSIPQLGSIGTQGYVAPELPFSIKSDIYSFGVMITAIRNLQGGDAHNLPNELVSKIEALEKKCQSHQPEDRPENFDEIVVQLDNYIKQCSVANLEE